MATGFLAAGVHSTQITANTAEKERYDEMDDMAATLGTSMLGLTVQCARCHDHKFDPIPTADYHRLIATFTGRKVWDVPKEVARDRERHGYHPDTGEGVLVAIGGDISIRGNCEEPVGITDPFADADNAPPFVRPAPPPMRCRRRTR